MNDKPPMNPEAELVKSAGKGATTWGVVTLIIGFLAMGAPFVTGLAVALMFGAILLVGGLAQTVYAFQAGSLGRGVLRFLFGGITVIAGLATLAQPGMTLSVLTLFLAGYFLADGLFTIFAGFGVEQGKGWLIFNGLITLVLGLMIWRGWPASTVFVVGVLVGIRLVLSGVTMLALGSVARNLVRDS